MQARSDRSRRAVRDQGRQQRLPRPAARAVGRGSAASSGCTSPAAGAGCAGCASRCTPRSWRRSSRSCSSAAAGRASSVGASARRDRRAGRCPRPGCPPSARCSASLVRRQARSLSPRSRSRSWPSGRRRDTPSRWKSSTGRAPGSPTTPRCRVGPRSRTAASGRATRSFSRSQIESGSCSRTGSASTAAHGVAGRGVLARDDLGRERLEPVTRPRSRRARSPATPRRSQGRSTYARLQALLRGVVAETGTDAGAYTVAVEPRVNVRGIVDGKPFRDSLTGAFAFRLDPIRLAPVAATGGQGPSFPAVRSLDAGAARRAERPDAARPDARRAARAVVRARRCSCSPGSGSCSSASCSDACTAPTRRAASTPGSARGWSRSRSVPSSRRRASSVSTASRAWCGSPSATTG